MAEGCGRPRRPNGARRRLVAPRRAVRLVGATVIDGTGRAPIGDAIVDIQHGRFVDVRPGSRAAPVESDVTTHDLSGLFVIPGLIDAHVHVAITPLTFANAEDPPGIADALLRSFVAHGVTTVRDPGTPDLGPAFQELKRGRAEWPQFFGAGPVIDGPPGVRWPARIVRTVREAQRAVEELADGGADLVKTYFWLRPKAMAAVIDSAHGRGLPVASHAGLVSVTHAIALGLDQVEHLIHAHDLVADGRERATSARESGWDPYTLAAAWASVDPAGDAALALLTDAARAGVTLTPTLVLSEAVLNGPGGAHAEFARSARMPAEVVARWEGTARHDRVGDAASVAEMSLDRQFTHIRLAHELGVKIAAGTGGLGNFIVPGKSLHDELALLVRAGLTPLDALAAATSRAADVVGRGSELGRIAIGAVADLVVLDADPVADIANTRRIRAVIKGGDVVSGHLPKYAGVRWRTS